MNVKHIVIGKILLLCALGIGFPGTASAEKGGNEECPVGLVKGLTLDEEFGAGTQEITHCIEKRTQVKVVMQINRFCRDSVANSDCLPGRGYGIAQLKSMIANYTITHGMTPGRDFELVAVVHDSGGFQMLTDTGTNAGGMVVSGRNQFQADVEALIAKGVKFQFCQNTVRGLQKKGVLGPNATAELIEGVEYTTAGLVALADLQSQGYLYIQP